jgi:hypothetical protein
MNPKKVVYPDEQITPKISLFFSSHFIMRKDGRTNGLL